MKIYAVDQDKKGVCLADLNVAHCFMHHDKKEETVTIMMGSIVVEITDEEVKKINNKIWQQ